VNLDKKMPAVRVVVGLALTIIVVFTLLVKLTLLTRWLPAYGIFVIRFWPKKQQFSVALPAP